MSRKKGGRSFIASLAGAKRRSIGGAGGAGGGGGASSAAAGLIEVSVAHRSASARQARGSQDPPHEQRRVVALAMSAAVLIHGSPPGDHDAVSVSAVLVAPLYLPGHTSGATGWSMRARGRLISLAVAAAVLGAPVRVEHRHAAASCLGRLEHKVVVQTIKRRFELVFSRFFTRLNELTVDHQRFFHPKHRIRIEVLVAFDEQLCH